MADGLEYGEAGTSMLKPVPRPNRDDLRSIPVGSEALLIESGTITCIDWAEPVISQMIDILDGEHDRYEGLTIVWIAVPRVAEHSDRVLSVDDIIDRTSLSLSPKEMVEEIVRLAREGMVENPF